MSDTSTPSDISTPSDTTDAGDTTAPIAVRINGEAHEIPPMLTVADLIVHLGKDPRLLAVEKNQELVPRKVHAGTAVEAGDQIEIVTLVGGG